MNRKHSLSTGHARSVFTNSCLSVPQLKTKPARAMARTAPARTHSARPHSAGSLRSRTTRAMRGKPRPTSCIDHRLESSNASEATLSSIPSLQASLSQHVDYEMLFRTLMENNSLLHEEVDRLKREHTKALARLNTFYHDQVKMMMHVRELHQMHDCDSGCSPVAGASKSRPKARSATSVSRCQRRIDRSSEEQYETPDEFTSSSENDDSKRLSTSAFQMRYSPDNGLYPSPGMVTVGRMWDNFSVEDFSLVDFSGAQRTQRGGRSQSGSDRARRVSSPKLTVPKPFKMTLREENTLKKKSKSMALAEKECTERAVAEESECAHKFRANPMPASTLLPLYSLINAKNEQRRELVKRMSSDLLKSSQKPFVFTKRDEARREESLKRQREAEEEERRSIKEMGTFRAKPVPSGLLAPSVEEEAEEKEQYRKIRIQMRAEKLLADAKAPSSMQIKAARPSSGGGSKKQVESSPPPFQPRITHRIPDYDKAYTRFQRDLANKKQSKLTTASEPFLLHTGKRAKKTVCFKTSAPPVQPPSPPKEPICKSSSPTYLPQQTETTRQRQELAKKKLAEMAGKEAELEEEMMSKRKRALAVQKLVAQKSSVLDMTEELDAKRKAKLEEFRKQNKKNSLTYKKHLDDMKKRVEERPLLLEQASKQTQEAKESYAAALKKAGLSADEIELCTSRLKADTT